MFLLFQIYPRILYRKVAYIKKSSAWTQISTDNTVVFQHVLRIHIVPHEKIYIVGDRHKIAFFSKIITAPAQQSLRI